ncbi:hypothetical protein HDC90_002469 [Pedobacter sp. AK013]|uniref:DUF5689 domain-containing protein n=1 Tax=Pedobacter sp. AK013 TaxID=2723071 RepID=UPI00160FA936|nr:DUF5689 domain-containing protein [Pedobacter sp. AK013]MBB6237845.1 hypothetical protein [Pedobacter sp. AK013]
MKKIILYSIVLLAVPLLWSGCKKSNYPGGTISAYIPLFDLRSLYKGSDVTLNIDNMFGSTSISAVVVSDHSGKNLPAGLLIVQDKRRLGELRGIAIPIGADAAKYVPGDSVTINVEGGVLKRIDGILQITNIPSSKIEKKASNVPIPPNRVPSSFILANPEKYESTLVVIVKGGFDPLPQPTDVLQGDKMVNDGFDNITLHTEVNATFANKTLPISANFYGIILNTVTTDGQLKPQHRLRTASDIAVLSSTIEIPSAIITGWIADPMGTDANNEYIQFLATRDINFTTTPFSVVSSNNAGASTPQIYPTNGWALGDLRTYKFNLTSGTVSKGQYFYVGGANKLINSTGSTSIASSKWIRSFNYSTTNGDGFGTKTSNLLANSGNAYGIAIFEGTTVDASTKPIDVVFVSTGGQLYQAGPPEVGFRIANTDFYDIVNPITLAQQPFYRAGTNTLNFAYHPNAVADQGYYYKLGGIYSVTLGKWVKARAANYLQLSKTSTISAIEQDHFIKSVDASGNTVKTDTITVTKIK